MAHLLDLPDELLLLILSQCPTDSLLSVLRVCRRLRTVASDESLWRARTLDFRDALVLAHAAPTPAAMNVTCALDLTSGSLIEGIFKELGAVNPLIGRVRRLCHRWKANVPMPLGGLVEEVVNICVGPALLHLTLSDVLLTRPFLTTLLAQLPNVTSLGLKGVIANEPSRMTLHELFVIPSLLKLCLNVSGSYGYETMLSSQTLTQTGRRSNLRECVLPTQQYLDNGFFTVTEFPYLERLEAPCLTEYELFFEQDTIPPALHHLRLDDNNLLFHYPMLTELHMTLSPSEDPGFFPDQTPRLENLVFTVFENEMDHPEWTLDLFRLLPSLRMVRFLDIFFPSSLSFWREPFEERETLHLMPRAWRLQEAVTRVCRLPEHGATAVHTELTKRNAEVEVFTAVQRDPGGKPIEEFVLFDPDFVP